MLQSDAPTGMRNNHDDDDDDNNYNDYEDECCSKMYITSLATAF